MPAQLQTKSYFPAGGLNSDTNSLFVKDSEFVGVNNLRIKPNQIQTRSGCKLFGNQIAIGGVSTPVLHFHTFKVPNGAELYFAFTKNNIYKYDFTGGVGTWVVCLDTHVTFGTNYATFWSTTDFIDQNIGSTVIAACSAPVNDISAETDSSVRKLLYWNSTDSEFQTLSLAENVDIVDEDIGMTIAGTTTVQTDGDGTGYILAKVDATNTLYPGTFTLSTDELGTFAYSDGTPRVVGGVNVYPLIPVDQTRIQAGDSSYIRVDGKKLSISFLTTDYAGLKVKVSYTYQEPSYTRPRFVKNYYNRLMMANMAESDDAGATWNYYPWRVRWTEVGLYSKIVFTSYQDVVEIDTGGIVGWQEQGFYLTVLKRNTIYKCSHIGGDVTFLFQAAWRQGSPSGRTLETFNGMQYFVGDDDVYSWDGNTLRSITIDSENGNFRVKNSILNLITFDNALTIFSSLDYRNKEYWIWIPGSTTTTVFVYSIPYDTWTKFTYSKVHYSVGYGRVEVATSGTWDGTPGTWDQQGGNFSEALEGLDKIQFFGTSGYVYASDEKLSLDYAVISAGAITSSTSIPSSLITKDFIFSDVYRMDRTQRVELDLYGTSVVVGWDGTFSQDTSVFRQLNTVPLTPAWERRYYYPDAVAYQVRFSLTSDSYIALRLINIYALDSRLADR